ncbi:MAG: AmmeMemoRadiSam system protein B [Bacteroidetes bacterium]|nr:AmmeMemoRadiSam system protein B [Bacteroidota bacterium]
MNNQNKWIRKPVVAGMFYDEQPDILRSEIERYLRNVPHTQHVGKLYGLIVPHAGYVYSGQTAAYSYRLLQKQLCDRIVVIGPSHREYFNNASVYPGCAFRTPLGDYGIDEQLRTRLLEQSVLIQCSEMGHRSEHSIEVQVPFLQIVQPNVQFLPITLGNQSMELCVDLASALVRLCKNADVIFVASSDLSHYHPQRRAVEIDTNLLERLKQFEPEEWFIDFEAGSLEACGGGAIGVVMKVAKALGATRCEVLHYSTSGDVSGDYSGVVGYVAAAFLGD